MIRTKADRLPGCTFLCACKAFTLTAEVEKRIQTLEMRCFYKLLNFLYINITNNMMTSSPWQGNETQMILSRLTFLWHGKDSCVRHIWRDQRKGQAEKEMGRQYQELDQSQKKKRKKKNSWRLIRMERNNLDTYHHAMSRFSLQQIVDIFSYFS